MEKPENIIIQGFKDTIKLHKDNNGVKIVETERLKEEIYQLKRNVFILKHIIESLKLKLPKVKGGIIREVRRKAIARFNFIHDRRDKRWKFTNK